MPSAAFLRMEAAGKARQGVVQRDAQLDAAIRAQREQLNEIDDAIRRARLRYRRELADHMASTFQRRPSAIIRDIVAKVCEERSVSPNEIFSSRRSHRIVIARHEIFWLVRRDTELSFPQIARHFKKDHSTILHGCMRHEARMAAAAAVA